MQLLVINWKKLFRTNSLNSSMLPWHQKAHVYKHNTPNASFIILFYYYYFILFFKKMYFILPLWFISFPLVPAFFLPFCFAMFLNMLDEAHHQWYHFACKDSSSSCSLFINSTESYAFDCYFLWCFFFFLSPVLWNSLEWKGFIKVIIIPHLSAVNYLSHLLSLKWSKASYLLCSSSLSAVPLSSVSHQHCLCSLPFIFCTKYQYCSQWSRGSQREVTQMIC